MRHYVAFHLGFHCLPNNPLRGLQATNGLFIYEYLVVMLLLYTIFSC